MKHSARTALAVSLFALAPALPSPASDGADLLARAQREMLSGNTAAAKAKFEAVLAQDPANPTALGYLKAIEAQEAEAAKKGTLQADLDKLVLERIDLKEADFGSAIEHLKQQAAKRGVNVNFVSKIPPGASMPPVTLSVSTIPFMEALRYICELGSTRFEVQQHAVVIEPAQ
jgi:hypothetical protein